MFNLILDENDVAIKQTDPRELHTLVYELRRDGKTIPKKVVGQFTQEQMARHYSSLKEVIMKHFAAEHRDIDAETFFTRFLQNLLVMGFYPQIMGKNKKVSKLIQMITGSEKSVIEYVMNNQDFIDEILCCFFYKKIKNGYNSVYCVDHLFNWSSELESSDFLDKFNPSQILLKNRSSSGHLQFKGRSGFLEIIPFNTEAVGAKTFN